MYKVQADKMEKVSLDNFNESLQMKLEKEEERMRKKQELALTSLLKRI
jgi:hypothetical protein